MNVLSFPCEIITALIFFAALFTRFSGYFTHADRVPSRTGRMYTALFLCAFCALLTAPARPASAVEVSSMTELQNALDSQAAKIVLTANIEVEYTITFNYVASLDLNGNNLDLAGGPLFVDSDGKLTIGDNSSGMTGMISGKSYLFIGVAGSFKMEGGTISGSGRSVNGVRVSNGGSFTMTGGKISGFIGDGSSISYAVDVSDGGSFMMTGGEISGNELKGGGAVVSISGNGTSFTMTSGKITGNTATDMSGSCGSGVCVNDNASFEMTGGEISGNQVTGTVGQGGGVYVYGGTFIMTKEGSGTGGTITNNTASASGGGVYVDGGSFTMSAGEISNNTASASGGGVYFRGSSFTMTGGTISDNQVTNNIGNGGGVIVDGGTFTIEDGNISGNKITGTNGSGGGVYVTGANAKFTMSAGMISENEARFGGGVYVRAAFTMTGGKISENTESAQGGGVLVAGSNATFTMSAGEISGNKASQTGGGVHVAGTAGTFTMTGGTISENNADNMGGGVYVTDQGTFTMTGGEISGNKVTATDDGNGGGVYVRDKGTFTMAKDEASGTTGTISDNTAPVKGGGVYVTGANAKFTMSAGEISGNTVSGQGGGVYVNSEGNFTMTGGTISGNKVTGTNGNGGGVYVDGGTFTMAKDEESGTTGKISGNYATKENGKGGGVYVDENGTFTMIDGEISGNRTDGSDSLGGGVYFAGSDFTMKGGKISRNLSYENNSLGGGVYIKAGTFALEGGEISENRARDGGGGVYFEAGTITMNGGKISRNTTSEGNGGGVCIADGTEIVHKSFTMKNGEISGNTVTDTYGKGGGVYMQVRYDSSFTMEGGKISGNKATNTHGEGGGIYIFGGIFEMTDGEISGNRATESGGGVYILDTTFKLGGGKVSGNQTGSNDDNIYLFMTLEITVTGKLSGTDQVGVTMRNPGEFTSGLSSTNSPLSYFFSDDPGLIVRKNASGEAELVPGWYCGDPDVNNGRDVTCVLDDAGHFTVSGSGAMKNYSIAEETGDQDDPAPWEYRNITSLVFEEGITSIGDYAFYECSIFENEIKIPEGVTVIGESAFATSYHEGEGSWYLELPASLESIGDYAFFSSWVSKVTFTEPSALTSIGYRAFAHSNLTSITIPAGVTSIGELAFEHCKKLSAINVAAGNKNYANNEGDGVLFDADKTTLIQFPAGKRDLDITDLYTIPDGVRTIKSEAIAFTSYLISLDIPASVTSIGSFAFKESEFLGMGYGIIIRRGAEALTLEADVFYDNNIMNPDFKEVQLIAPDEAVLTITPDTDFSISEDMKTLSWTDESTGAATLKVWYPVVFLDEDGTTVLQSGLAEGAKIPEYTHETPTKASDETYSYTFAGWTPELKPVDGSAVYTAKYTKTPWPKTAAITNSNGTDITGKTVTPTYLRYRLKAVVTPEGASQAVKWTSSNTDVAAVSSTGLVTFKKPGTVTITAASKVKSGVKASVKLKLLPEAESVTIKNTQGRDLTGKTVKRQYTRVRLIASAEPEDAAQTFKWTSSDTTAAVVDSRGLVTSKKVGTATITATSKDRGGASASVTLKLLPAAKTVTLTNAQGTDVTGTTVTRKYNFRYRLVASAKPKGAIQTFTWKSSNPKIATVDYNGLVTFKKAGKVTITATSTDRGGASASVIVKYAPEEK